MRALYESDRLLDLRLAYAFLTSLDKHAAPEERFSLAAEDKDRYMEQPQEEKRFTKEGETKLAEVDQSRAS